MVEIYNEPELLDMVDDEEVLKEWKEHVAELGMTGQADFIQNDSNPSIYQLVNTSTMRIFNVLCPATIEYSKYNATTIPLEVLKEIALCEKNKYFYKMYIKWDDVEKDPILLGKVSDKWDSPIHLIARWGDEILPMSELKIKAINRYIQTLKHDIKNAQANLECAAERYLSGEGLGIQFTQISSSVDRW